MPQMFGTRIAIHFAVSSDEIHGTGHTACAPCSVRFYGSCWNSTFPPDYAHCSKVSTCAASTAPRDPQEFRPAATSQDKIPKPRLKTDPAPKTDPKVESLPKADTKNPTGIAPKMNIIYQIDDPDPRPSSRPSLLAKSVLRWRNAE